MKIAITGALGHIGSRLIRELPLHIESEIIMIDNLLSQRYCSLFDLQQNTHYQFIEADIMNADLKLLLKDVDVVVHLAAITNAAGSFEHVQEVENVNFVGTQRVVEACISVGAKLIFLSTTSVYGTQKDIVDESCSKDELSPQSPYADSKLKSEEYLKALDNELNYVILRFGTIAGHSIGMRFHTAVNKFCWQAVMKQPITVWRTAYYQKRPYLDLIDAVNALIFVIKNNIFDRQIYNVLTQNCTVAQIVDMIKVEIKDIDIDFVDTKIMNQLSYEVENSKFKKLGFVYSGNIGDSIQGIISVLKGANSNATR